MSRPAAFALVGAVYAAAAVAAWGTALLLEGRHPLLVVAAADLAATVVVFAASVACDNSSVYDPYWSVAPPAVAAWLALGPAAPAVPPARQAIVCTLVAAWGVRLTWNWARGWPGLAHEDWRYVEMRRDAGRAYWVVSFLGIHLFPTLVVLAAMAPLWPALATGTRPLGPLDAAALLVTAAAVALETVADEQLRAFRRAGGPGRTLDTGVWARLRHPNYLGEMGFWWGLWLFGVAADPAAWWWTAGGALAITAMFLGVSIPWKDRRMLASRPAYAERMRTVGAVVPRWR